jgi:hypothetical protein
VQALTGLVSFRQLGAKPVGPVHIYVHR